MREHGTCYDLAILSIERPPWSLMVTATVTMFD